MSETLLGTEDTPMNQKHMVPALIKFKVNNLSKIFI